MTAQQLAALNAEVAQCLGLASTRAINGSNLEERGRLLVRELHNQGFDVVPIERSTRPEEVPYMGIVGNYHAEGLTIRRVSGPGKMCGYTDVRAYENGSGVMYKCMVCNNVMPPAWPNQVVASGLPLPRVK